jgi:hypothetical protein
MAECYTECRLSRLNFMLSVAINPFMLSVIMLRISMLSVVILSVIMLSVIMLSVVILSVVAPHRWHR